MFGHPNLKWLYYTTNDLYLSAAKCRYLITIWVSAFVHWSAKRDVESIYIIDFWTGSNVHLMYILVRLSSCQGMNSHNFNDSKIVIWTLSAYNCIAGDLMKNKIAMKSLDLVFVSDIGRKNVLNVTIDWAFVLNVKRPESAIILLHFGAKTDNIITIEPRDSQIGGAAKIIWLYRGLVITGFTKKSIYLMKSVNLYFFYIIDFV